MHFGSKEYQKSDHWGMLAGNNNVIMAEVNELFFSLSYFH